MHQPTKVVIHVELSMSIDLAQDIDRASRAAGMGIAEYLSLQLAEAAEARAASADEQAALDRISGEGNGDFTTLGGDALELHKP